jgi:hypothetical protein
VSLSTGGHDPSGNGGKAMWRRLNSGEISGI